MIPGQGCEAQAPFNHENHQDIRRTLVLMTLSRNVVAHPIHSLACNGIEHTHDSATLAPNTSLGISIRICERGSDTCTMRPRLCQKEHIVTRATHRQV